MIEIVAPSRLGVGFRWLLRWIVDQRDLGDGFAPAAGPLLIASQTNNAFVISLAALVRGSRRCCCGLYAGPLGPYSTNLRWVP